MGDQDVKLSPAGSWVLPKPFHGTAEENLDAFLRDFDDCLEANGFVPVPEEAEDSLTVDCRGRMTRMAVFILKRSLQGPAAQTLASLSDSDRGSLDTIKDALRSRYGDEGKVHIRQAELYSRKRLPGESLSEMGTPLSFCPVDPFLELARKP